MTEQSVRVFAGRYGKFVLILPAKMETNENGELEATFLSDQALQKGWLIDIRDGRGLRLSQTILIEADIPAGYIEFNFGRP